MDYETFNLNPKGGRVSQFACIRTDKDLAVIPKTALSLFCTQTIDNLPSPEAAIVTNLTPQKINRIKQGIEKTQYSNLEVKEMVLNEYWFTSMINEIMSTSNTCVLGYNSLRFDDEFTRNLLYRNLFDPYQREWKDGNSRFDVYLLVLASYVLKPELINFPNALDEITGEQIFHSLTGRPLPSFRLEDLSTSNGIHHSNAHDAFNDVEATMGIFKKIQSQNIDFVKDIMAFRNKNLVKDWLNNHKKPFIHISQFYGKEQHSFGVLYSIFSDDRAAICLNLNYPVDHILRLSEEDLYDYFFNENNRQNKKLVVVIYFNQCPILAKISDYPDRLQSFNVDRDILAKNLNIIKENINVLAAKLKPLFLKDFDHQNTSKDTDLMIYSGFFNEQEKKAMGEFHLQIRNAKFNVISSVSPNSRLIEMSFKIIARNFPGNLNGIQLRKWRDYAIQRLTDKSIGAEYTIPEFINELNRIKEKYPDKVEIIKDIQDYANSIFEKLGLPNIQ
jgi:exodeoxyribonuclease-1